MGYYTYFSISIDNAKPDQFIDIYKAFYRCMYDEEIDPSNKTHPYERNGKIYAQGYGGREYEITDIGDQINSAFLCEDMKWYDSYEDMQTISRLFPDVIFHLGGDGEDSEDACQKAEAMGYDDFEWSWDFEVTDCENLEDI